MTKSDISEYMDIEEARDTSYTYSDDLIDNEATYMYTKACWDIPVEEEYKKKEKEKVFEKERKERWVDFLWSGGRSLKSSTFRGSPGHTRSCRPFEETSTNCLSGPYLTVYSTLRETIGYLPPLTDETVLFCYYFLKNKIPILYKKRYLSDRIKVVYKRIGLLTRKKDDPPFLLISWLPLHLPSKRITTLSIYTSSSKARGYLCYKTSPVVEAAYLRFSKFNHQYLKIKKRSSKCTQQPPFFFLSLFNQNFKRILQICMPLLQVFFFHGNDLEPKGLCALLSSLAQFLLWKEGNFFVWQSTHNKRRRRKKKRNPVKLIVDLEIEHRPIRPWTLARSKPVKQTSLTITPPLAQEQQQGEKGKQSICIDTISNPYFLHHHEPLPFFSVAAAAKK